MDLSPLCQDTPFQANLLKRGPKQSQDPSLNLWDSILIPIVIKKAGTPMEE